MEVLLSLLLSLVLAGCADKTAAVDSVRQDGAESVPQETELDDSVFFSQDSIDINIWQFNLRGRSVNIDSLINLERDDAVVSGDTLIVVTSNHNILPFIDVDEIFKPLTESEARSLMGSKYTFLKNVDDLDKNGDGENYEIPWLFFVNEQDSIQYEISGKPKFRFVEGRFSADSHNQIARQIFRGLSQIHIERFTGRYPYYKHIWFLQTYTTKSGDVIHTRSIFITLNDSRIEKVMLTVDYETIIENIYMLYYLNSVYNK